MSEHNVDNTVFRTSHFQSCLKKTNKTLFSLRSINMSGRNKPLFKQQSTPCFGKGESKQTHFYWLIPMQCRETNDLLKFIAHMMTQISSTRITGKKKILQLYSMFLPCLIISHINKQWFKSHLLVTWAQKTVSFHETNKTKCPAGDQKYWCAVL